MSWKLLWVALAAGLLMGCDKPIHEVRATAPGGGRLHRDGAAKPVKREPPRRPKPLPPDCAGGFVGKYGALGSGGKSFILARQGRIGFGPFGFVGNAGATERGSREAMEGREWKGYLSMGEYRHVLGSSQERRRCSLE